MQSMKTALLVAAMLLVPRKNWLVLIPAGLAGAAVENLRLGFTLGATGLFSFADTIQVLIIGLGLGYSFDGVPRLNSSKALGKYCFLLYFLGRLSVHLSVPARHQAHMRSIGESGFFPICWLS